MAGETIKKAPGEATQAPPQQRQPQRWRLVFAVDARVHAVVLLLLAAILFSNGVGAGMAFDDKHAITDNRDAHSDKTTLSSIFFNDFWGTPLHQFQSNGSYRPITVLTFRIQHWLMGYRHSTAFLHAFNYAVAYLNVCLVFYLARLYAYVVLPVAAVPTEASKLESFTAIVTSPLHAVPFMAALLYLVHPVHVDAVTSIVGRCELLYCLFGLIGFFCIHLFLDQVGADGEDDAASTSPTAASASPTMRVKGKVHAAAAAKLKRPARARMQHGLAAVHVLASVGALILSVLCKDSAITFTAIYGVHACVMYACGRCQRARSLIVIAVALVELISYLVFRSSFVGQVDLRTNPMLRLSEHPMYFVPEGLFHWLSIRWVIQVKNLELLFFPTSLCNEYSYNCIPHMSSLQDPRVPFFTAVTAATLVAVAGCVYGTFVVRSRVALAGLLGFLWIAIPYAPVSHLFIAVGTFIAERCLYVPSIGAVLLLTFAAAAPGLRRGVVGPYFYLLLLLCAGWGGFSHRRNEDWLSNEHLALAATRSCPNSGKAHYQLAVSITGREGRVTPEALALVTRSLQLDPTYRNGYQLLAMYEVESTGDVKKAYEYLRLCVNDTFSNYPCQEMYQRVRAAIFPQMTEVEASIDFAELSPRDSHKAVYLRQAGIQALQRSKLPCQAQHLFDRALTHWNNSGLYWVTDEMRRDAGDNCYCNALYWHQQAALACAKQGLTDTPAAPDAKSATSKPARLTPRQAAADAVKLAERFQRCGTDWRELLAQPGYHHSTYPYRTTQYLTIGGTLLSVLGELYLPVTAPDTVERNAVLLSFLDLSVRQYCHVTSILHDAFVRDKMITLFPEQVHELTDAFPGFRTGQLTQLPEVAAVLHAATLLTPAQAAALHRLRALATCSDDLAFLSSQSAD